MSTKPHGYFLARMFLVIPVFLSVVEYSSSDAMIAKGCNLLNILHSSIKSRSSSSSYSLKKLSNWNTGTLKRFISVLICFLKCLSSASVNESALLTTGITLTNLDNRFMHAISISRKPWPVLLIKYNITWTRVSTNLGLRLMRVSSANTRSNCCLK